MNSGVVVHWRESWESSMEEDLRSSLNQAENSTREMADQYGGGSD
jgi:hypothetical protein